MAEDNGSADAGNPDATETSQTSTAAAATPATPTSGSAPADGSTPPGDAEAAPSILDGFGDPDLRTYAEGKGFDKAGFEGVVKSYSHLEKIMSADKAGRTVLLLGDDPTEEQSNEFFSKLGRPKDAAGYEIAAPEGEDGAFAKWAGDAFFSAGLSRTQAAKITEAWGAYSEGVTQTATDAMNLDSVDAQAELKKDWGAAYEQKVKGVDAAAARLGFTEGQLVGLRNTMGAAATMRFIDGLNTKMGDHNFDSGESVMSNLKTPEQARLELGELTMSKEFMDAWLDRQHPGHAAAVAKKATLAQMAAGVQPS